jgi:hypothetical protein
VDQTFLQGTGTTDHGGAVSGSNLSNLVGGGGQLTTDLTNFGNLIRSWTNDPSQSFGSPTTPETFGIGAAGQLDHHDKPAFKDLLPKDPHSGG